MLVSSHLMSEMALTADRLVVIGTGAPDIGRLAAAMGAPLFELTTLSQAVQCGSRPR